MGWYYYPTGGYHADGYNLMSDNGRDGLSSKSTAVIWAGTTSNYKMNSVYGNSGYNVVAAGSGSAAYSRCNWWDGTPTGTHESSGGVVTSDYHLDGDPRSTSPNCSTGTPQPRTSARGPRVSETASARALLLDATESIATDLNAAIEGLIRVAAEHDSSDFAKTALVLMGSLLTRPNVPQRNLSQVDSFLVAYTNRPNLEARNAAIRALTVASHLLGETDEAVEYSRTLIDGAQSIDDVVFGELALASIFADSGHPSEAWSALGRAELIAPYSESVSGTREDLSIRFGSRPVEFEASERGRAQGAVNADRAAMGSLLSESVVYPNPIDGVASVVIGLDSEGSLSLDLFDTVGRHVRTVQEGVFDRGRHQIQFQAPDLTAGTYMLVIRHKSSEGVEYVWSTSVVILN